MFVMFSSPFSDQTQSKLMRNSETRNEKHQCNVKNEKINQLINQSPIYI